MTPTIRFVTLSIPLAMCLSLLANEKGFQPGPAGSYPHQTAERVTVAAKPYDTESLTEEAFGKKVDFLRFGVLPVLVVIENKGEAALDLHSLEVNLVAADGRHAPAMNPDDVLYLGRNKNPPNVMPKVPLPKKKNPLAAPEITARAFAAKMLPPGESTSGFFYFEAKSETGDKLYLDGLREARSGREILFFEFPLSTK